jgi:voltage-gated sodium channel
MWEKQKSAARGVVQRRGNKPELVGFGVYHSYLSRCYGIVLENNYFQLFIVIIIFAASILVGVQTYTLTGTTAFVIDIVDEIIMGIFIAEIFMKWISLGRKPYLFFTDGWNVFDFIVVASVLVFNFLNLGGAAIKTLRLVRLMRVFKLVKALPKLRILVMGLIASLSSILYVGLLLFLLIYIYMIAGITFLGGNDPGTYITFVGHSSHFQIFSLMHLFVMNTLLVHFGNMELAFMTLLQCLNCDNWTYLMYISQRGCDKFGYEAYSSLCVKPEKHPFLAPFYYITYVVMGNMLLMNLFVGVVTSSIEDAKEELEQETKDGGKKKTIADMDRDIGEKLRELNILMLKVTQSAHSAATNQKLILQNRQMREKNGVSPSPRLTARKATVKKAKEAQDTKVIPTVAPAAGAVVKSSAVLHDKREDETF